MAVQYMYVVHFTLTVFQTAFLYFFVLVYFKYIYLLARSAEIRPPCFVQLAPKKKKKMDDKPFPKLVPHLNTVHIRAYANRIFPVDIRASKSS